VKLMGSAFDEAKGLPWREETEVRIDLPLNAFIPNSYIADENLRLEAYRRIAAASDGEELNEVRDELLDRYGSPLPDPVAALFEVAALRRLLLASGITEAATVAGNVRVRPIELEDSRQIRLKRLLPEAQWRPATQTLLIPERLVPKAEAVTWLTRILQQLTSTTP
jgi:transcription-repair coupling factor (superfamily II helicase)